jgi:hypothetical protein
MVPQLQSTAIVRKPPAKRGARLRSGTVRRLEDLTPFRGPSDVEALIDIFIQSCRL